MNNTITGVILSGGKSRRFGSDKAMAIYQGRSLIMRAHESLCSITPRVVVSVDDPATRYRVEARHVCDHWKDCGPLSGIASAFRETDADQLIVLACDLPRVTTATLRKIIEEYRPAVTLAKDVDNETVQPLCAMWDRCIECELVKFLENGYRSVFEFLKLIDVHFVGVSANELLNVNRPLDLSQDP